MAIFTTDEFVLEKVLQPLLTSNELELSEDPVSGYDPGVRLFRIWRHRRLIGSLTYYRIATEVYLDVFEPNEPVGHPDAQVEPFSDLVWSLYDIRGKLSELVKVLVEWADRPCPVVSS